MRYNHLIKKMTIIMAGVLALSATGCGNATSSEKAVSTGKSGEITITMGRQTLQNPKMPEGDTYEDNAYTRMVKDELGIKIVDEFEANGDDYNRQVSLAISAGEIPDVMRVSTLDELQELYENDLIADLTDVYEEYASDNLKGLYDSYDGRALDKATFEGQLMALPGTNVDAGPSEVWIRSDWMGKLGIEIDSDQNGTITIDELEMVAKKFMENNPGNAENPVGLAFAPWLTSGDPDGTYSINSIAYALGAYPKTWIDEKGKVEYGSISPEMKDALALTARWYEEGLIDAQLGTRTWDDITSLLTNGETGITFGTWHIPDWLLNNVRTIDPNATFESYAIENADGKVVCKHNDAAAGFIVVSKKCQHPEAAIQIANLFYDTLANSSEIMGKYPEVTAYISDGVDGSTRPFNIEIKSATSLLDDYSEIVKGVKGEIDIADIRSVESKSNVESITRYLNDSVNSSVTEWSKYHSRMKGIALIQNLTETDTFDWMTPVFPKTTPTMETNQANLDKLEEETFIKIATGAVSVEEGFSGFVKEWNEQGGEQICKEIAEQLQ